MINHFFRKFKKIIISERLIKNGERILIGISGGIDSTVLLYLIKKILVEYKLTILAVQINYNLRGKESKKNENFVRMICYKWSIPLVTKQVFISGKSNIENKARVIRYNIFNDLLDKYDFDKIALGHNKNDQAETLLLNLFRGTGIKGMKGMSFISQNIIRPLLNFNRKEITDFANHQNIKYFEDTSNYNLDYDRNKIRNKIIPSIEKLLNPKIIDKISNSALIFQQTEEFLQYHCEEIFLKYIYKHNNTYKLKLEDLRKLGILQFYFFKKIFGELMGDEKKFYTCHYKEILNLIKKSGSKYISLPKNVFVIKEPKMLTFSNNPPPIEKKEKSRKIMDISKRILFDNYYILTTRIKTLPLHGFDFSKPDTCYLDYEKVKFPLTIRHRRPGDSFIPLGMKNPKKLKNLFIDEKIPRYKRGKIIIIEDQNRIIWIVGIRVNDKVKITSKTKEVLKIQTLKKLEKYREAKRQ